MREAIAGRLPRARRDRSTLSEIFVSDGAKSDSGNIQSIFSADAVVAVQDPAYPVYVDTNVMAGRTGAYDPARQQYQGIVYMPCNEANGFFPELPGQKVDLVYLCSPNNPTGAVATQRPARALRRVRPGPQGGHPLRRGLLGLHPRPEPAAEHLRGPGRQELRHRAQQLLQVGRLHRRAARLGGGAEGADGRGLPGRASSTACGTGARAPSSTARPTWSRPAARPPSRPRGARSAAPSSTSTSSNARIIREGLHAGRPHLLRRDQRALHLGQDAGRDVRPGTSSTGCCARRTWSPPRAPGFGPSGEGYIRLSAFGRRADTERAVAADPGRAGEEVAMPIAPFGTVTAQVHRRGRRAGRHAALPLRRGDDRRSGAGTCWRMPSAFGMSARFAMKANSSRAILELVAEQGMGIDASSLNEVRRARRAGDRRRPDHAHQPGGPGGAGPGGPRGPDDGGARLQRLLAAAAGAVAPFARARGVTLSVRVNPGVGAGESVTRNTGDKYSSFGVHLADLERLTALAREAGVSDRTRSTSTSARAATRPPGARTSTGCWRSSSGTSRTPTTINLGGGFKEARMPDEQAADIGALGEHARKPLRGLRRPHRPQAAHVGRAGHLRGGQRRLPGHPGDRPQVVGAGRASSSSWPTAAWRPTPGRCSTARATPSTSSRAPASCSPRSGTSNDPNVELDFRVVVGRCCESGDSQSLDHPRPHHPADDGRSAGGRLRGGGRGGRVLRRRCPPSTTTRTCRRPRCCSAPTAALQRHPQAADARPGGGQRAGLRRRAGCVNGRSPSAITCGDADRDSRFARITRGLRPQD